MQSPGRQYGWRLTKALIWMLPAGPVAGFAGVMLYFEIAESIHHFSGSGTLHFGVAMDHSWDLFGLSILTSVVVGIIAAAGHIRTACVGAFVVPILGGMTIGGVLAPAEGFPSLIPSGLAGGALIGVLLGAWASFMPKSLRPAPREGQPFQFSLRTLLVITLVLAMLLGWVAFRAKMFRDELPPDYSGFYAN